MGLFDRFSSKKGKGDKQAKAPKHTSKEDAQKAAFAAVGSAGAPAAEKKSDTKRARKEHTGHAHRILIRPIVTEKSSRLGAANQYVFEVALNANKVEVKRAVRHLYGHAPIRVNLARFDGKVVRYGRSIGRTKDWKKAIVTFAPGTKIQVQE